METKLGRIADKSAREARPIFTSLYHLLNEEMLNQCHRELSGNKAVGIDEVTKEEYSRNLEDNIQRLVTRHKHKAYKPQPVKRLGLKKILEAVYEPKFQNEMYGFQKSFTKEQFHMMLTYYPIAKPKRYVNLYG